MSGLRKLFGRPKTKDGRVGAIKEIAPLIKLPLPAADGTLTTVAVSPEPKRKPELYSTAGSTGIRVVANPVDAILESVIPLS